MLNLIVATRPEARPILERFKLQTAVSDGDFPLYYGSDLQLIIAGIGKVAAAAATGYLHTRTSDSSAAWLNIGIAGHGECEVGTALLTHKIIDQGSGRTYYPIFSTAAPCATTALITVDRPEDKYPERCAYDMEASGFWAVANRFSTAESIHCLKIVSDNPCNPIRSFDKKKAESLVAQHLDLVGDLAQQLSSISDELARRRQSPADFDHFLERWHFTATQTHQLRHLLQHWHLLAGGLPLAADQLADLSTAADVLCFLRRELAALPLDLCLTSSI